MLSICRVQWTADSRDHHRLLGVLVRTTHTLLLLCVHFPSTFDRQLSTFSLSLLQMSNMAVLQSNLSVAATAKACWEKESRSGS